MIKKLTRTIPPKRGPNPQGLNVPLKQVKIKSPENINGRYRQVFVGSWGGELYCNILYGLKKTFSRGTLSVLKTHHFSDWLKVQFIDHARPMGSVTVKLGCPTTCSVTWLAQDISRSCWYSHRNQKHRCGISLLPLSQSCSSGSSLEQILCLGQQSLFKVGISWLLW